MWPTSVRPSTRPAPGYAPTCLRSPPHCAQHQQYEDLQQRGDYFDVLVDGADQGARMQQLADGPVELMRTLKAKAWSQENNMYL